MVQAVIFDLGGTLVDWPDWDEAAPRVWAASYQACARAEGPALPAEERYVSAMRMAEAAHWVRVDSEYWSGPPSSLVMDGFGHLQVHPSEAQLVAALDGYAAATANWSVVFEDSAPTLSALRESGLKIGLLSNTWWAADWHNADIAAHGLAPLIDELAYTSDLPHSKPHPSVFLDLAERLQVPPSQCVMVGDRPIDDIEGAMGVGMRGVWKTNGRPREKPDRIQPTAIIEHLRELLPLVQGWRSD